MDALEELKKKKKELIEKAKALSERIKYKRYELKALEQVVSQSNDNGRARKLARILGKLEFELQTKALSLTAERRYMKRIFEVKKELEVERAKERRRRKLELVRSDIEKLEKEKEEIENQIKDIKSKIAVLVEKKKHKLEGGEIHLGDIAVIKKVEK